MKPLVSVVIPTYKGAATLPQSIDSVFDQTFTDYELIVVNDGSPDETSRVLESYKDRIRTIDQPNQGVGAARNKGINFATGKYVALLDHDDLWLPDKLQTQVDFLEKNPECIACIVPYAVSIRPTEPIFDRRQVADSSGMIERPLRQLADRVPLLMTCSVLMFNREKARDLRFATVRGAIEDVSFQIRLLARGGFGVAGNEVLAIYRVHQTNTSGSPGYFYEGRKLLRGMDAAGEFSELSASQRRDMLAWLAFLGRAASVSQLLHGRRLNAIKAYFAELLPQLRDGHLKFVVGFPALALSPRSVVKKWANRGDKAMADQS